MANNLRQDAFYRKGFEKRASDPSKARPRPRISPIPVISKKPESWILEVMDYFGSSETAWAASSARFSRYIFLAFLTFFSCSWKVSEKMWEPSPLET